MWYVFVSLAIEQIVSDSFCGGNVRKQFLAEVADVSGRASATSAIASAKEIRVESSWSPYILIPVFGLVLVFITLIPLLHLLQIFDNYSQKI
jgi:hypothetical protein